MEIGPLVKDSEYLYSRNGGFDVYAVSGDLYRDRNGKTFWLITVVSDSSKKVNQTCIVYNNSFSCCEVGIMLPDLNIVIGDTSDLDSDVRQKVQDLLLGWEECFATA